MEISKKAVEKLQERTATANACGVRLFLTQFGCSGYKYDLKLEYKKPTLDDIVSYEVHFLYDPTNQNHTLLIQDIKTRFKSYFGDFVGEIYPTDVEFDQFESNFI